MILRQLCPFLDTIDDLIYLSSSDHLLGCRLFSDHFSRTVKLSNILLLNPNEHYTIAAFKFGGIYD